MSASAGLPSEKLPPSQIVQKKLNDSPGPPDFPLKSNLVEAEESTDEDGLTISELFRTSKRHDAVGSGHLGDGESLGNLQSFSSFMADKEVTKFINPLTVSIENVTLNATVETGFETAKEDADATETGNPSHDMESFQGSETDDDQFEAEIQELQIEERVSPNLSPLHNFNDGEKLEKDLNKEDVEEVERAKVEKAEVEMAEVEKAEDKDDTGMAEVEKAEVEMAENKDDTRVFTGQPVDMNREQFNNLVKPTKWLSNLHIDSYLDVLWKRRRSNGEVSDCQEIGLVPTAFFAHLKLKWEAVKNKDDDVRIFKVPNTEGVIEEGKKTPTKYRNIKLCSIGITFPTEILTPNGSPSVSGVALKSLAAKISAQYDFADETSDLLLEDDADSAPTSTVDEADSEMKFGTLQERREAFHAIASLCKVCSIDSLISNFILPLQGSNIAGKDGRVHCSLNINTETGRLSARRPNLQNQPALEKDRYKIRQAFIAAPGNSLVVADYGQLELRILAHLANCKSMLDAFKAGGDFHSRTAMNMYPHIREAVEMGQVLLEWHPQPGETKPPVPLLKDAFASERRKAKMLNFSIAYGKTPKGLARDWKVSLEEAKHTVDLWYKERQEVLKWQEARKKEAREHSEVHTLLGRARRFPSSKSVTWYQRSHIERAAINTPVQGSAADVAMCAMIEISKNTRLKELGWKLLLQIHDEVILEGPSESAEVAKAIVEECMSKPFNGKNILKVDLNVDAKCAQNWYDAK
ncbi:hypothetical protein LWI29_031785 [Acer saccharum]|uniref:DNA-directed DNA polymerase family A palm domain-containing protein n=1 Tax=Acer saccharum TaxID=4024 RepID=A0AA39T7Q6_ACESA|nr:hypothetical protein LWI29_031785 [Acer saccharum]